jgi:hypothetical protein
MTALETDAVTVDKAVRDYILSGPEAVPLAQLRDDIAKIVHGHPTVESVQTTPRGKAGACVMKVYGINVGQIATVTIKANGTVEAVPVDAPLADAQARREAEHAAPAPSPTLVSLLCASPGIGPATADAALADTGADRLAPFTPEQVERSRSSAAKPGLKGKARAIWIITGETATQQAKRGRLAREAAGTPAVPRTNGKRVSRKTDQLDIDVRAAHMGTEAAGMKQKPLSQRISAKEAAAARHAMHEILEVAIDDGGFPNAPSGADERLAVLTPAVLGFKSERAMLAYVDGRETGDAKSKAGAKALTKAIGSHQVWARKAVAAAYGVMSQTRADLNPGA